MVIFDNLFVIFHKIQHISSFFMIIIDKFSHIYYNEIIINILYDI